MSIPAIRSERQTQNRLVKLFTDPLHPSWLGYRYLGNWEKRAGNSCIEVEALEDNLKNRGYSDFQIAEAIRQLQTAAEVRDATPYQANMRTYDLLRYGAKVQAAPGEPHKNVHYIDWKDSSRNDFGLAEEVTLRGNKERRPDVVLYINGIAVAVLELKKGSVEIGEGVRQLVSNQNELFNPEFFSTVQLLAAGNDSQGLRYGTIETPEQFYVNWKAKEENHGTVKEGALLDWPVTELFDRDRLLDLMHHFVIFDGGVKKVPRPHQYAGIKAAQERMAKHEGGVIWHTQGSGKSILMVLLAKWVLEHDPEARVFIVTDRIELDKQITSVMRNAGVIAADAPSPRVTSRLELAAQLASGSPRLMCGLIHKFPLDEGATPPPVKGRFYVFVDECHRTQSGDMNKQMRLWLPDAIFIGFTGTPLLKKDKKTTRESFGKNIHTYKFDEAVRDGVVLDLKYHARKVQQTLTAHDKVDAWFDAKTQGLNGYQRALLRKKWAKLEVLMSSADTKRRIIADIAQDFDLKPRLSADYGTAILVASSIYDACDYYRKFQDSPLKGKVGLVTSYIPNAASLSKESKGSDEHFKFETYVDFILKKDQTTKAYEEKIKQEFINEPAKMKLLIVVSKLLTGFDAPSCTYIYLDDILRDHTLFQAICRTNRLDGDNKPFGHIVDYRNLFANVEESIAVYTSDELDTNDDGTQDNIKLGDWREDGKRDLEEAREKLLYLCEPIPSPKHMEQYLRYFGGNGETEKALLDTEPLRIEFYKHVASFVRAYSQIAEDLVGCGYSLEESKRRKQEVDHFSEIRDALKQYTGEVLDIKPFERDMRHLINMYVTAEHPEDSGRLDSYSLLELVVESGINDAIAQRINAKNKLSKQSIAETIINNVRRTIIRDRLNDPRFYAKMSELLDDLIQLKRQATEDYEEFLRKAEELIRQMQGKEQDTIPEKLKAVPRAYVIYNNLSGLATDKFVCPDNEDELADLTLRLDQVMREDAQDGWKSEPNGPKGRKVKSRLYEILDTDGDATEALFEILKRQEDY